MPTFDMTRPLLLDLFCGAGGAAMGYHRAGFDVVGVDTNPQPNYPFSYYQHDALDFLKQAVTRPSEPAAHPWWSWGSLSAIHASPPCQRYSLVQATNPGVAETHPDFLPQVRGLLRSTNLPYVIENVVGAPMHNPIMLCGEMFGLDVIRHRLFESNKFLWQPEHPPHRGRVRGWRHGVYYAGPYVAVYGKGGGKATLAEAQAAMGIDWTDNLDSINEAIPPTYTEYIGAQLLQAIKAAA